MPRLRTRQQLRHRRGELGLASSGIASLFMKKCGWASSPQGKLLGALVNLDTGAFAEELVMRGFVGILKAAPPADVVHEHSAKRAPALKDVRQ